MLMALESTASRMNHMGKSLLMTGRVPTADEIAVKYDAVTSDDIMGLAAEIFKPENVSISAVTKEGGAERYLEWIGEGFARNFRK
jgi:predicted Zn-dependent peptidase